VATIQKGQQSGPVKVAVLPQENALILEDRHQIESSNLAENVIFHSKLEAKNFGTHYD